MAQQSISVPEGTQGFRVVPGQDQEPPGTVLPVNGPNQSPVWTPDVDDDLEASSSQEIP